MAGRVHDEPSTYTKIFMVPYEENAKFMCREDLLLKLHNLLSESSAISNNDHRVALSGMGGVGKTQTAIAYIYRYLSEYDHIFWISGANEASLLTGLREIAIQSCCAIPIKGLNLREIAPLVLGWLRRQENWLLVVDNLDHVELIKGLLPERALNKHTLITTRDPNPNRIPARGLEIPLLDADDGMRMLYALSEMPEETGQEDAREIVTALGCLPLAISYAASYVREVTQDFGKFLERYHTYRKELHEWVPPGNQQYSSSLATAWSISFEYVRLQHPPTAKLLQYLSFLNPDEILLEFLQKTLLKTATNDDMMRELVSNVLILDDALSRLEKFSLIRWSRGKQTLSIHRLVQAVVKDGLSESDFLSVSSTIVEMCGVIYPDFVSPKTLPLYRRFQSQVLVPLLQLDKLPPAQIDTEMIYRVFGDFLMIEGKFDDCERLFSVVERLYSSLPKVDELAILRIRFPLSLLYRLRGRLTEAEKHAEQNLASHIQLLGENHPDTVLAMENLAELYRTLLRKKEAVDLMEKALSKRLLLGDQDQVEFLRSINFLASNYGEDGRTDEAAKLHERALSCQRTAFGDDDFDTMRSMRDLGCTYHALGRFADAAPLLEEYITREETVFGQGNSRSFTTAITLSSTYVSMGRLDDAVDLLTRSVVSYKVAFGEFALETLVTEASLAGTYALIGKPAEATRLLERIFSNCKQLSLGEYNREGLKQLREVCEIYRLHEKWNEAAELLENIRTRAIVMLGEQHEISLDITGKLSSVYDALGKLDLAIELRTTSLLTMKKIFGGRDPRTIDVTKLLINNYRNSNRLCEAAELDSTLEDVENGAMPEFQENVNVMMTADEIFEQLTRKYPLRKSTPSQIAWRRKFGYWLGSPVRRLARRSGDFAINTFSRAPK